MTRQIISLFALVACASSLACAATYTLVTEPDEGRLAPIYSLLSSAKSSLDITMYELTDAQAEQLLAQAASSGVTARSPSH